LCSGYQQICQKVAPTIRQYGEREIPGGLEAAGLMRAVKASAEGTAQAIAMARTVQSFFCLGRFESCLPPSLKAKGAVGIIWLDPILRPLYWKEFTAFVTVLAEFFQSFASVLAEFSFQLFSGEAVFAPGIPRNKSSKARRTAVASSMAERWMR
jgi:hypothetical protein